MDVDWVDERHRAVCAIGGIPAAGPPLLMGSGYCVNGQHRMLCSCAHVWNCIAADDTNLLDPAVHGVAIGFRPSLTRERARAERGEVDWVGRAVLLTPPGVLQPPSFNPPSDGLDFVALQLTQLLDGSPLPPDFRPLIALPLGDPDSLRSGDELTMLGFGVIGGPAANRGNARPRHPKFSNISNHPATGRWIETGGQEMAHSGHSGGPVLGPHGELVGWVVWTVGPRAVGARPSGLPLTPPVSVLVAGVDQLRPVDTRFENALSEALDALLPATNGEPLRDRLGTGGQTLPRTPGGAGHTAAAAQDALTAAQGAQAAADGAQATAESAQTALQPMQQAVSFLQNQHQQDTVDRIEQLQLEMRQLKRKLHMGALQLPFGQQSHTWHESPHSLPQKMMKLDTHPATGSQTSTTPMLSSPSTSRESSPGRSSAHLGLVIDGAYPDFKEADFKRKLAKWLKNEVCAQDISIRPAVGRASRVARVRTGSCEVKVNCEISGLGDATEEDEVDEEERVQGLLKQLIEIHWPRDVEVTDIHVTVSMPGSIILVLELPQPLPVLLMQLARQASAKLLEAVPGLLCCQLGDSVVRLEGCEDGSVKQLALAMKDAKVAASETCNICGRKRSTCSYGDVESFEPSIGAIVFAENHFAALGLKVEQANDQDFASKVESAFRRLARVHPDKQREYLDNVLRSEQVVLEQMVPEQEPTSSPLEPAPEPEPQLPESDQLPQRQPRKLWLLRLCCTAGLTHFFSRIRRRNAASCKLDASAVSAADDSAVPVAEGSASLPPVWIRAGSKAAFQRLEAAKETLLDDAARAAHVDEIRNGSVRRGKWECDAREALKEEDLRKQQIQRKAEAAAAKAKKREKEAQIAGLFATLRACKPEDEVLPLINKATATQKDEVPL